MLPLPLDVPVDPDAPEARRWILDELSKPQYAAARPSWWDLVVQAIGDWLSSLRLGSLHGPPVLALAVVGILLAAGVVVGLALFGRPRLGARSRGVAGVLEDEDERDAATMRRDADRAASTGDWPLAIAESFRALARGLAERSVLALAPGTTAHGVAREAARAFPSLARELEVAARDFDAVRYLGASGGRDAFERLRALDRALDRARPVLEPEPARG